jgi:small subunit ribosomal protein S17
MSSSLLLNIARTSFKNTLKIPTVHSVSLPFTNIASFSTSSSSFTNVSSSNTSVLDRQEIYKHYEDVSKMTNEQLLDPSTIPGFSTLIHSPPRTNTSTPRNALVGTVVSDKMDKTVNVRVDRYKIIPKYQKRMKYSRKFMAHDEKEVCGVGDLVMIVPCQKISRKKHFRVHEIIRSKAILS